MTTRPPRAPTRGDVKRPKTRGMTQGEKPDRAERPERADRPERPERADRPERPERADKPERPERADKPERGQKPPRAERPDKRRAPSIVPTDRFERIDDDAILEIAEVAEAAEAAEAPALRLLVLESGAHLGPAQDAIALAGHVVAGAASGPVGAEQLRAALGEVDALLVGLPGGEPLIEAALAHGPARPVVIAACTSGAVAAARRAAAAGADLFAVRPHDVERLAPILFAAARLVEQRQPPSGARAAGAALDAALDELSGREPGAILPFELFQETALRELERAGRYAYALALAMFRVDMPEPAPPPGVSGILRARAGNALVHAIRDIDLVTELAQDRFLVLLPHTDRLVGAEVARRILGAIAAVDPVVAGGRSFSPKVIGAVTGARPGEPLSFTGLVDAAAQLLEQAAVTGASLAVDP